MKKIILLMTLAVGIAGYSFAAPADMEPSVLVKTAFTKEFADINDVKWQKAASTGGVYEASFTYNNENVQAYFTEDGEFLGTVRLISASRLPVLAANALAKKYADYHLVGVFEYSKPQGVSYYITLSNPKGGLMLEATGTGDLTVYKRIKL